MACVATGAMFDWFANSDVEEFTGDPIANAFEAGKHTEYLEGEVDEYDGHKVYVEKKWEKDGDDSYWLVKIHVPNGQGSRSVTEYFDTQFVADAVFEKLQREYDLHEYDGVENDGDD